MTQTMNKFTQQIVWLDSPDALQVSDCGGKAAGLGLLLQAGLQRVKIPRGFVIPAAVFAQYRARYPAGGTDIRAWWHTIDLEEDFVTTVTHAYEQLGAVRVAVRSSATAEDLPGASYAGQHESFTGITSISGVLQAIKDCWGSLYTDRARAYRAAHQVDESTVAMAVIVQEQVITDQGASGVAFTVDPETGNRHLWTIQGIWGAGELLVQGTVTPQEYRIATDTVAKNYRAGVPIFDPVIAVSPITQEQVSVYGNQEQTYQVHRVRSEPQCLSIAQLNDLLDDMYLLTQQYPDHGLDIEWAHVGLDQPVYLVQMRSETVHAHQTHMQVCVLQDVAKNPIAQGVAVGSGIVHGRLMIIDSPAQADTLPPDAILVTDMTSPDWMPVLTRIKGLVTRQGGRTCHAAIVARELRLPTIVGIGQIPIDSYEGKAATLQVDPPPGNGLGGTCPFCVS